MITSNYVIQSKKKDTDTSIFLYFYTGVNVAKSESNGGKVRDNLDDIDLYPVQK